MKRNWIILLIWLLLACLLAGCGNTSESESNTESESGSESVRETESESETETESETESETEAESETESETETEAETEIEEPAALWKENGAVLRLYDKESGDRAILYKAPDESFLGDAFGVELSLDGERWYPLDVWTARVAVQVFSNIYDLHTTYFVNFDFEGEALLRVTPKASGEVKLRPVGKASISKQAAEATVIRLTTPCQLSFEVGGNIYENLQIFANPIEEIDRNDPDVIYLEAGLYTADNCELIQSVPTYSGDQQYDTPMLYVPSGKTLYLSGGAVVRAQIVVGQCEDVSVKGRGTVDILPWNRANNIRASSDEATPAGVRIENSKNVLVEGIVVRDSMAYSIYAGNSTGVAVDNFKCIAAAQWSDGFDSMAVSDVVIKNSFFRTNDDCIAIYGSRWNNKGDSRNYEIYDCVLWADNAHAINMANHGSNDPSDPDIIENIHFHDIDILEVHSINWTGAISVMCGGENILRNVTFERFEVEFTQSDLIRLRITQDGGYYGRTVESFTFRDIFFEPWNGQVAGVYLQGYNAQRKVKNIHFDNVWIGNEKIVAGSPLLRQNKYTSEITFE